MIDLYIPNLNIINTPNQELDITNKTLLKPL